MLEDDPFEVKLRDNYAVCCYSLLYVILLRARCLDNTDKLALLKSSLKTETKREREKLLYCLIYLFHDFIGSAG